MDLEIYIPHNVYSFPDHSISKCALLYVYRMTIYVFPPAFPYPPICRKQMASDWEMERSGTASVLRWIRHLFLSARQFNDDKYIITLIISI